MRTELFSKDCENNTYSGTISSNEFCELLCSHGIGTSNHVLKGLNYLHLDYLSKQMDYHLILVTDDNRSKVLGATIIYTNSKLLETYFGKKNLKEEYLSIQNINWIDLSKEISLEEFVEMTGEVVKSLLDESKPVLFNNDYSPNSDFLTEYYKKMKINNSVLFTEELFLK